MSSSSNYDSSTTPILPSRNVVLNNLRSNTAQVVNLSVDLINGQPPPTAPPISKPVGSILSVISPGVAGFSEDVDFIGDIRVNGFLPINNQVLIGGATNQWDFLNAVNFDNQTPNTVLNSNGSGVVSFSKLPTFNITPGADNEVMTVFSGNAEWNLLTEANFAPNLGSTVLCTGLGGVVDFQKLPVKNINPGTSYQIIQTSNSGTEVEWSSRFNGADLKFSNNPLSQTVFDKYYKSGLCNFSIFTYRPSTDVLTQTPNFASVSYVTCGDLTTLVIREATFAVTTIDIGSVHYGAILLPLSTYPWLQPKTIIAPSTYKQTSGFFSYKDGDPLTNVGTGLYNVYPDYYASDFSMIEFLKADTALYTELGNHGTGFTKTTGLQTIIMELSSPLVIQYINNG